MNVFCVGPEQVDSLWNLYAHHLERFERETEILTARQIYCDLRSGDSQLWGYQSGRDITGVVVTRIFETPIGRCCEIVAACGAEIERGQIEEVLGEIERWAKDIGSTRIRILGRRGWMRRLRGFHQTGVIMEREIN